MPDTPSPKNRRKWSGLVVNRAAQFKLAVACSSLILLPSLILSISLIANLAKDVERQTLDAVAPVDVAQSAIELAFHSGLAIAGVFFALAVVSVVLSLKLSNHMIGPVALLETQLREMVEGNFTQRRALRKGDYLGNLGALLNQLAEQLEKRKPQK